MLHELKHLRVATPNPRSRAPRSHKIRRVADTQTGVGAARSPAMTDVAKAAAVSHQTVSRVLNGHPNVRPATRERVLAAIEQLGYRPNLAARALASGRSTAAGPGDSQHDAARADRDTLRGRAGGAQRRLLGLGHERALDRPALSERVCLAPGPAGRRRRDHHRSGRIRRLRASRAAARTAAVVVEADPESAVSAVTVDSQVRGISWRPAPARPRPQDCVPHLGPEGLDRSPQRVTGWRRRSSEAGAPVPELIVGDWSAQSGYEAGRVLAAVPEATAVFAANDNMALGLLARAQRAGTLGAERNQHRRLRRHRRSRLLHATADVGAPGLRRDGPTQCRAAAATGRHRTRSVERSCSRRNWYCGKARPGPDETRSHPRRVLSMSFPRGHRHLRRGLDRSCDALVRSLQLDDPTAIDHNRDTQCQADTVGWWWA